MAKMFNNFTLMVILALASRVVLATEIIEESISPESPIEEEAEVPAYDEEMPPEPSPEEMENLHGCMNKMTEECAKVILEDIIFTYEKKVITDDCCRKLVFMGRQCHDSLVKLIIEIPAFKGNASITVPKSVEVWDKCVKVAGDVSPTPSSS